MSIDLQPVTRENVRSLRHLNHILFPMSYHDSFYTHAIKSSELARIAYLGDTVVGTVCCRLDGESKNVLYIMALGCLPAYRRQGIARKLLQYVLDYAESKKMHSIDLHVQVDNEAAIELYKKFGFETIEIKKQYYPRIQPADAYFLQKKLTNNALVN